MDSMRGPYIILVIIALGILAGAFFMVSKEALTPVGEPDGADTTSGVRGIVLLGPQCPVVRVGESCGDTPYSTTVRIFRTGSNAPFLIVHSDAQGRFESFLEPGAYTFIAEGGTPFPSCGSTTITVLPNTFVEAMLSCDTGIR
jgi:hypothetical protein